MAMRCPCTNHLYYISTYISPSRQQKSILQLCRSGYSHAFLPPKSCPWPSSTMCQTTESSNVRASFNLVKVFFCFFFLELEEGQTYTMNLVATAVGQRWCANAHKGEVSYILAAGVRRGADAKAIVGERRTVVTSTWRLYQWHTCTCTCTCTSTSICIWVQNRGHLHLPIVPTAYRMIASSNLLHA